MQKITFKTLHIPYQLSQHQLKDIKITFLIMIIIIEARERYFEYYCDDDCHFSLNLIELPLIKHQVIYST